MRAPWLRLYTDLRNKRKVMELPADVFRVWVLCLCAAKDLDGSLPCIRDLAFDLRCDEATLAAQIKHLISSNLIDEDGGKMVMHDWSEHQYETAAERMRNSRERKKTERYMNGATSAQHSCNGGATVAQQCDAQRERERDTEADTEAEREKERKNACANNPISAPSLVSTPTRTADPDLSPYAKAIFQKHPKGRKVSLQHVERALCQAVGDSVNPEQAAADLVARHAGWCESADWRKKGGEYCPWIEKWLVSAKAFADPPSSNGEREWGE